VPARLLACEPTAPQRSERGTPPAVSSRGNVLLCSERRIRLSVDGDFRHRDDGRGPAAVAREARRHAAQVTVTRGRSLAPLHGSAPSLEHDAAWPSTPRFGGTAPSLPSDLLRQSSERLRAFLLLVFFGTGVGLAIRVACLLVGHSARRVELAGILT